MPQPFCSNEFLDRNVIALDLGGTWFRAGLVTPQGRLWSLRRRPAVHYKHAPDLSVTELQQAMVTYILGEVARLRRECADPPSPVVGISIGAALNAHTGLLLNSGPLWGPTCQPWDLHAALSAQEPTTMTWVIVNDITAALRQHVAEAAGECFTKMTLLTVSTGLGCRTYDARTRMVPTDSVHGLQGEIGHLPITFEFDGHRLDRPCDCGGLNHLNAFCSGRGIEGLLPIVAALCPADYAASLLATGWPRRPQARCFTDFATAVHARDGYALRLLDAVTRPVADMLRHLLTFDPEVDRIILTGGVVHGLGPLYLASLYHHLDTVGLYQISNYDPGYFERRIRLGRADDAAGLLGAARIAAQQAAASALW